MLRNTVAYLVLVSLFAGILCGCNSGDREVSQPQTQTNPHAGGLGAGNETPKSAGDLKALEASYDAAKKAYEAAKDDPKAKQAFVDAGNKLGNANLNADELSPKVKYPNALKIFREVLKVDPKNENAKNNAELIVSIYKQMGRPIPGGG